ncbi:MAG: TIGR02996 domain-containing protein [Planctomycetia bacterium]|nr:TIGR02996 domain-containing protein [Planctomycetia bacterium]
MTPDEAGFFRTILDHPDDDAPRLIYADWLEDRGESERAEFIRVQCELAAIRNNDVRKQELQQREKSLYGAYSRGLEPYFRTIFPDHLICCRFDRGVPSLDLDFWKLHSLVASVRQERAWIDLNLTLSSSYFADLARLPLLKCIVSLTCRDSVINAEEVKNLIDLASRLRLHRLHFRECDLFTADAMRVLAAWPELTRLSWLGFSFCDLTDLHVAILAQCPYLSNLRSMQLGGNHLGNRSPKLLANAASLCQLRSLGLSGDQHEFSRSGIMALVESPTLQSLEEICCHNRYSRSSAWQRQTTHLVGRFRPITLISEENLHHYNTE